jgi:hypothetical protein
MQDLMAELTIRLQGVTNDRELIQVLTDLFDDPECGAKLKEIVIGETRGVPVFEIVAIAGGNIFLAILMFYLVKCCKKRREASDTPSDFVSSDSGIVPVSSFGGRSPIRDTLLSPSSPLDDSPLTGTTLASGTP